MNMLNCIMLMAPQGGAQGGGSGVTTLIFLVLIIAIFYFFMIRPQMKQQKKVKNFRDSLKAGDRIVTIGGIHGKISDVKENTFVLEIDNNVRMSIEKTAV